VYSIYRYLDKLQKHQVEQVKSISFKHTLQLFGNQMSIVFYNLIALYFKARMKMILNEWRVQQRWQAPAAPDSFGIVSVRQGGYRPDYDVFDGDKYEVDTLLPIIEYFVTNHKQKQLIVLADAGLLSQKNMALLTEKQFQYILGARIKNENAAIRKQVLDLRLQDVQSAMLLREDDSKLIVSYKKAKAVNDYNNRQRGLEKLEKKVQSGRLTKRHISNKGYNKYLKIAGQASISVDKEKFEDDKKWDCLKGHRTNTNLSKEEVIEQYHQLWQIEKAFKISKHDLQIRPIYRRLKRRIEAHICIAFAICKIYKELKRQLKEKQTGQSPEQAIDILKTMLIVQFTTPYSH
jgi:transposase